MPFFADWEFIYADAPAWVWLAGLVIAALVVGVAALGWGER